MERETVRSLILGAGIVVGGSLVGSGLARVRASEPYVTVKGIAEHEVRADLAIWPIHVTAADNDLATANAQLQKNLATIRAFLVRHQIDTAQSSLQGFSVSDASTNQYATGQRAGARYVIKETLVIRSTKPDLILSASQSIAELVGAGVVLSTGTEYGPGQGSPTFVFTGLNKLKPQMIGEATARAREAAEQFARDSRSSIGGIRYASQGVFAILPRDQAGGITEASQIVKTVRVVSTIDYFLR